MMHILARVASILELVSLGYIRQNGSNNMHWDYFAIAVAFLLIGFLIGLYIDKGEHK